MTNKSKKISLRLETAVYDAIDCLATQEGVETNAYIEWTLKRIAVESGFMRKIERDQIMLEDKIISFAVKRARQLEAEGKFEEHFTLKVFQNLMEDTNFRKDYENAVGGDAYEKGLKGKTPLNMYLGWYIKNAVGADPVVDSAGKVKRVQVSNEPIRSYTMLTKSVSTS